MSKYQVRLSVLMLATVSAVVYLFGCQSADKPNGPLLDIEAMQAVDSQWEVTSTPEDSSRGAIMLTNDRWLMYFLHTRPLTDSNRAIDVEYVKSHLLNFWGPSMPFTLSGIEGETSIAGHKAYYVEATLNPNRVRTRFIVWNCEETGRQFTADCNINLIMKTPPELFDIQQEITRTICCHGQELATDNPDLPNTYINDSLNIAFAKPADWRTSTFAAKTWFPDGQKADNATLWTLIPNSEKYAIIETCPGDLDLNKTTLDSLLQDLPNRFNLLPSDSAEIEIVLDSSLIHDHLSEGIGQYRITQIFNGEPYTDGYKFRSLFWRNGGKCYLLFVSMAAYTDVWNRPFDLVPSDSMISHVLWKEVAPYIGPFPEGTNH